MNWTQDEVEDAFVEVKKKAVTDEELNHIAGGLPQQVLVQLI
jgi:hypothetical protein